MKRSEKSRIILTSIICLLIISGVWVWAATSSVMDPTYISAPKFVGDEYWLGDTEVTDRFQGTWDVGISAPYLNATSGIYLNSVDKSDVLAYPVQAASYILFNSSSVIWAKNGDTGQIDYGGLSDVGGVDGANASAVIQATIDAGPGLKFIKEGIYSLTSSIVIDDDGIEVYGVSCGKDILDFPSPPSPLPSLTSGTIFRVIASNIDAIRVKGERYGIVLRNFGIEFTEEDTGHGINCVAETGGIGLNHFVIEDIFVSNHDGAHYALRLESFRYGYVRSIHSFGGGLLELAITNTVPVYGIQLNCGNTEFIDLFGWITKSDLTAIPFYSHREPTDLANGVVNLNSFNRVQLNAKAGVYPASINAFKLQYNPNTCFQGLNIEVPATYIVNLLLSGHVVFVQPFIYLGTNWAVDSNSHVDCFGGYIDAILIDTSTKSRYFGTTIINVSWEWNKAKLINCLLSADKKPTENSGTTSILNGTTSIVITHGLGYTPTSSNTAWTIAYLENPINDPGSWYIDTFTSTQATIHVFRDPGISNLDIAWSAGLTP